MKVSYVFMMITIAGTLILVIGLRGAIPQRSTVHVDGTKHIKTITGLALGRPLWSDGFTEGTEWKISGPNDALTNLQIDGSLNLTVTFSQQHAPRSVVVSRTVDLKMADKPIVALNLTASEGIHYGVRFSGVTDGSGFEAWHESSRLQHRPGLALMESLTLDLGLEMHLATGYLPLQRSVITRVSFYMEAPPGTSGTYSLEVEDLRAFSLMERPVAYGWLSGEFIGLEIETDISAEHLRLSQVIITFDIRGTPNLRYIPYLTHGLTVLAQGFTYVAKSTTTFEVAILTPQRVSGLPQILSTRSSFPAIILAISTGIILEFRLEDLALRYTSTPVETLGHANPAISTLVIGSYFLAMFLAPVAAVVLVNRVFDSRD